MPNDAHLQVTGPSTNPFFDVAQACLDLGLGAAAVVFQDVRVGKADSSLRALIKEEIAKNAARLEVAQNGPELAALHAILRRVGTTPRRTPPAIQRLRRQALRSGDLPAINNVVDAYNLTSLRTSCCLGAHDMAKIALPVSLRLLNGDESFTALGATDPEPTVAGEFAYVDQLTRVICRLDVVQAEFSKVTESTTDVLLIIEATATHGEGTLAAAVADASTLFERFCGARVRAQRIIEPTAP